MEPDICGLDRLRLVEAPLAGEVRLHLAEDAIVWWARMEAQTGRALTAPFWATPARSPDGGYSTWRQGRD